MIGIITGDIVRSRKVNPSDWLEDLKRELRKYGREPKSWEIFKGDSFQVEIKEPTDFLLATLSLKACIKRIKNLDVRLSLGIGSKTYDAKKISESNGSAYINSGEEFENLKKKKQNILVKSPWKEFDKEMNFCLRLGLIAMDNWTQKSAEIVYLALQYSNLNQEELGRKLNIKQNTVSKRLHRAHYYDLMALNDVFQAKLKENLK